MKGLSSIQEIYIRDIAVSIIYEVARPDRNEGETFSYFQVERMLMENGFGDVLDYADLSEIIELLQESGTITADVDQFAGTFFQITNDDLDEYNVRRDDRDTPLSKIGTYGSQWRLSALRSIFAEEEVANEDYSNEYGGDPLAPEQDEWNPLPIDRDSPEFVDALEASEEAEKIIREDNGFAATHPEIRDSIVWMVGGAVNRLREGTITIGQVKSMLVSPFRKVSSLFAEGLLKEACERAIDKLIALL